MDQLVVLTLVSYGVDNIKEKLGMAFDEEIDTDTPEDMKKFLIDTLGTILRFDSLLHIFRHAEDNVN